MLCFCFQIVIICSEKGKFLDVFEIRGFFAVCKGGTRLRPNLHIDVRHNFLVCSSFISYSQNATTVRVLVVSLIEAKLACNFYSSWLDITESFAHVLLQSTLKYKASGVFLLRY